MSKLPLGYTCKCGVENRFHIYVYAHWDTQLEHTCECGRKNKVLRGVVTIGRLKKDKAKHEKKL